MSGLRADIRVSGLHTVARVSGLRADVRVSRLHAVVCVPGCALRSVCRAACCRPCVRAHAVIRVSGLRGWCVSRPQLLLRRWRGHQAETRAAAARRRARALTLEKVAVDLYCSGEAAAVRWGRLAGSSLPQWAGPGGACAFTSRLVREGQGVYSPSPTTHAPPQGCSRLSGGKEAPSLL